MRPLKIFLATSLALVLAAAPSPAQSGGGEGQSPGPGGGREGRGPGSGGGRGSRGRGDRGPGSWGQDGRGYGSDRSYGSDRGPGRGPPKSSDPNGFFDSLTGGKDVWKRSEADPRRQMLFDKIAEHVGAKNGEITREQFNSYMNDQAAKRGGFSVSPAGGSGLPATDPNSSDRWGRIAEASFRVLDKDGNGRLDYNEMPEDLRNDLAKWDTDHNGMIDLNEYKDYFIAKREQRAQDRSNYAMSTNQAAAVMSRGAPAMARGTPAKQEPKKPLVYTKANLPKEVPSWFRDLADADGQIALHEWRAAGKSLSEFRKYDLNDDGIITVDEVLALQNAQKKGTGGSTTTLHVARGGETVIGSQATFTPPSPPGSGPGPVRTFTPPNSGSGPVRLDISRFRNGGFRNRPDQAGGSPQQP